MTEFVMEYLPVVIVAAIIGAFTIAFILAYFALKKHKEKGDDLDRKMSDKEIVKVKIDNARPVVFDDVVVRVSPKFALAMHIDTDECNAAAAFGAVYGEIVK